MIAVKICGITNADDALHAQACGADAVGFVFAKSPRRIAPEAARAVSMRLGADIARVGVFVNAELPVVRGIADRVPLDLVQVHGLEEPDDLMALGIPALKAFRARGSEVIDEIRASGATAFLLDAFVPGRAGGTGKCVDLALAERAGKTGRLVLAGGLTPENVGEAVARVRPYGVDVSSGVESGPGRKDPEKVKRFIAEVKRCERRTARGPSADSGVALFRRRSKGR